MPNCFQLISRETGTATAFNAIDEQLCNHFKVPVHPTQWYHGWYDVIGFAVATGSPLPLQIEKGKAWMLEQPNDSWAARFLEILEWLNERYTTEAWVEIGK